MNLLTFLKKSINGELSLEKQVAFLTAKMEITPKELASVVRFLQKQMLRKPKLKNAIDVCGTGGSGLERINTSTISAFILASLGIGIAKHGNKSASGRFGSFDLLHAMGVEFTDDISAIEERYKKEKLVFLFAQLFHPVMKNFAAMRQQIGKPTFFNLLGPLLNPAFTKKQIIGTAFKDKMQLIAETCKLLGKEKVYVVCGEDGLDEVTLTGKTFVTELSNGKIKNYTITPEDFGIKKASFAEIKGGDAKFNTAIALDILKGNCISRHKDLILVNTALALKLVGRVKTLKEGYDMASLAINVPSILLKIVEHKKKEVEQRKKKHPIHKLPHPSSRDFAAAIKKNELTLIAEVKKSSPSSGILSHKRFSPAAIAQKYEQSGASAISVLCDKKFFNGDLKHLKAVAKKTFRTPLLCKDFIVDEYQIYEARKFGADAILLIASILTEVQINKFIQIAKQLNMAVICEVHTIEELKKILKTPANIIGINNRDLHTFKTDIATTSKIAACIPAGKIIISESGFSSQKDIEKLPNNVNAILVGTALMKGISINEFISKKIKICGIRDVQEARYCEKLGINFIGFNFVPTSKRYITSAKAQAICQTIKTVATVGIFQNQSITTVNNIAKKLHLNYIQLSGNESVSFVKKCCKPVIKTISLKDKTDLEKAQKYIPYTAYILLDSASPGAGKQININLDNIKYPFLLAGGISPKNVINIIQHTNPLGIDIASGIETDGKIDPQKIKLIYKKINYANSNEKNSHKTSN